MNPLIELLVQLKFIKEANLLEDWILKLCLIEHKHLKDGEEEEMSMREILKKINIIRL